MKYEMRLTVSMEGLGNLRPLLGWESDQLKCSSCSYQSNFLRIAIEDVIPLVKNKRREIQYIHCKTKCEGCRNLGTVKIEELHGQDMNNHTEILAMELEIEGMIPIDGDIYMGIQRIVDSIMLDRTIDPFYLDDEGHKNAVVTENDENTTLHAGIVISITARYV